jgi:Fe-S cluster assembly protein SufB
MKYPAIYLKREYATGEILPIAIASEAQVQDTGAKMMHPANNTTSNIVSKSISFDRGMASDRGAGNISTDLKGCKNNTSYHALLINSNSRTAIFPKINVTHNKNIVQHEASVSKISEE